MTDPSATEPAAPKGRAKAEPDTVKARVTKFGADKIFTGETPELRRPEFDDGKHWFPQHAAGDILTLPRKVAEAQEALGNVEIQD